VSSPDRVAQGGCGRAQQDGVLEHPAAQGNGRQPDPARPRHDQVRDRGYEMMASLQTAGVYNLSTPVLGPDGRAIAALTIPYITLVNAPAAPDITATIQLLQSAATRLSNLAGSAVKQGR